jgi:hypothetical protein
VPTDLLCTTGKPCTNHSPVFFSTKRLNGVGTYVKDTKANTLKPVDAYDFDYVYYGTADDPVDPALMLKAGHPAGHLVPLRKGQQPGRCRPGCAGAGAAPAEGDL